MSCMKRIKQLSKNLVNQIAAGEVIERPASVVKELVENSIDAGASKVEISISNECRNIRVADNGSGIHPDDIELAFSKHATSKILEEGDLWNISTLGFRGEALASVISVAKVTCTTRTKEFEYGTRVESSNSEVKKSKTGCDIGTVMEVEDLFFNQPARLKFLKSEKTEFAYIQEIINSIALSNPNVAIVMKNNNSEVVKTSVSSDLLTRISEVYSSSFVNELKLVEKTDDISKLRLSGYVSVPSYSRSSRKSIHTFVNSRIVKCPLLIKTIDMAYKNMLPSGKYPFVVLNLEINPEDIDVNAHPTKMEIRYKNPNQIFNFVRSAIDMALSNLYYPQNTVLAPERAEEKVFAYAPQNNLAAAEDDAVYVAEYIKKEAYSPVFSVKTDEDKEGQKILIDFDKTESKLEQINIIGQYNNTYILIENDDNLEIVDQHIADERYIYEKLSKNKECASQLLIISDVIEIEPSEVDILIKAKDKLSQFGYQVEAISKSQVILRKIPQILSHVEPQNIITELLENINGSLDSLEEKIIVTTSCKAAVKAGQKLNVWQMEELIRKWRMTKNPYTCPHGRPISHKIALKELSSFFLRS